MIGCGGYLAGLFVARLAPGSESSLAAYLVWPAGLAEISFLLWLLVKGAKVQHRWPGSAVRAQNPSLP